MREKFLLDPEVIFLNHGSFGACPASVFETYTGWTRELERQPVDFFTRRSDALLDDARAALGTYLNADAADLIFIPNATTGINIVARSLNLQSGDEILATDHEYGAVDYTWRYVCERAGAHYIRQPVELPFTSAADFVDSLWSAVTDKTRVIAISHITSPTALIFPVHEICRRAREAGITTVIDGAHVPGQLPLDLTALDADFYAGNCHKWLCAPKGSAFLYARADRQAELDPMVISWGYTPESDFATRHQWQGTRDLAAFLSVPAAISFMHEHDSARIQRDGHELACYARDQLAAITGLAPIAGPDSFPQMVTMPLPPCDALALAEDLYQAHRIEIPGIAWNDRAFLRVSCAMYTTRADIDALVSALASRLAGEYTENRN